MTAHASFEDLIYVLIGIVWIVFSIYNAKKKKDAKKTSQPSSKKESILDSLIKELGIEDNTTNQPQDVYISETDVMEEQVVETTDYEEKVFSYDDQYEESNYILKNDVIEKKLPTPIDKTIGTSSTEKKLTSEKKIRKNIDLRKAVIYSEIMKKVYF